MLHMSVHILHMVHMHYIRDIWLHMHYIQFTYAKCIAYMPHTIYICKMLSTYPTYSLHMKNSLHISYIAIRETIFVSRYFIASFRGNASIRCAGSESPYTTRDVSESATNQHLILDLDQLGAGRHNQIFCTALLVEAACNPIFESLLELLP